MNKEKNSKEGNKSQPHYVKHRQRMRSKLLEGGAEKMANYELLEMILYNVFRQADTKPIAKNLLKKFQNNLSEVIHASPTLLKQVDNIGDAAIAQLILLKELNIRMAHDNVIKRPVFNRWTDLYQYCYAKLGHIKHEEFHLLFLNTKNELIKSEMQNKGTVNHTPVYVREVIKSAIDWQAASIIMLHNHPSGDPKPSNEDIRMTNHIAQAAKIMNITLVDHMIIAGKKHFSFNAQKLIDRN